MLDPSTGVIDGMRTLAAICIYLTNDQVNSREEAEALLQEILASCDDGFTIDVWNQAGSVEYCYKLRKDKSYGGKTDMYWFNFNARFVES